MSAQKFDDVPAQEIAKDIFIKILVERVGGPPSIPIFEVEVINKRPGYLGSHVQPFATRDQLEAFLRGFEIFGIVVSRMSTTRPEIPRSDF